MQLTRETINRKDSRGKYLKILLNGKIISQKYIAFMWYLIKKILKTCLLDSLLDSWECGKLFGTKKN